MEPDDNGDWLHWNETYPAKHMKTSGDLTTPGGARETVCHPPTQNSSRAAYFSKWYKNLTPDEKESRRECLRLYNKTPKRKEAKRDYIRRRRELPANTLNPESIAMENPTFTPEIVHPKSDATQPDGSPVSARDWTEEVGSPDRCTGRLRHKHHVPSGERQSLLAQRNQQFEATVARNRAAPIEGAASIDDYRGQHQW
ncbi:hypothetical protein BS78_05G138900 [Paspalum vaginatum]|nr:hypothetical protein BS78_05G138900 [Paspalum vaginatum]